jgi:hypothetical protein
MNYRINNTVRNPLTDHLDKMNATAMALVTEVRLLRERAKQGEPLDGERVRSAQRLAKKIYHEASGL